MDLVKKIAEIYSKKLARPINGLTEVIATLGANGSL